MHHVLHIDLKAIHEAIHQLLETDQLTGEPTFGPSQKAELQTENVVPAPQSTDTADEEKK